MANTGQYDSQTNIELEDYEREIFVQPEAAVIYGGSVVNSVNGQTGDVVLTTSDLENTSDYQTGAQVQSALAGKQDKLTAGTGIDITSDVVSVDTTTIATHQDITNEATARENADTNLQGQIDALTVSSGVIDVLGTYQDLQNYDTTHVKENDIIKVLQDSTHSNAMSYYKWVITSNVGAWVYVGGEGPFYTKSETDVLLNSKQNTEDNSLETSSKTIVGAINEVDSIAKGANQALSFASYAAMVTEFNSLDDDVYNVGQNIYIQTLEVPDLWVSGIESTSSTYTYTTDEAFTTALVTNGYVQVGYYKLSALETQKVDLTNYVTNTDYATAEKGGTIRTSNASGLGISNGNLYAVTKAYNTYNSASGNMFIGKGTLENVITGKGLVSNTDYATSTTAGVLKVSNGVIVGNTGYVSCSPRNYADYAGLGNSYFISKGTLENVIDGKGLVDQTALAGKQDTLTAGTGISINNNVISATGGDTVYSSKTTSNSATGGAVYIGNLGTDQAEVADPTTTDNHYKYFWALPASNSSGSYGLPGNGSVNIMGSAKGINTVAIGAQAGMNAPGSNYAVMIGPSANAGPAGVSIGDTCGTTQDYIGNVCIGAASSVLTYGTKNSVALGRFAQVRRTGEVNVGTGSQPTEGFSSSNYRVIGGVYDGQELHDAATVAQGNTLATSAPTTSTVGVLGQLYTDTTNMHTYQCTAISGGTYTWTQRW